jgi:hypothetical protein
VFAVDSTHAAPDDPLAALKIGEQPEPRVRATADVNASVCTRIAFVIRADDSTLGLFLNCREEGGTMVTACPDSSGHSSSLRQSRSSAAPRGRSFAATCRYWPPWPRQIAASPSQSS